MTSWRGVERGDRLGIGRLGGIRTRTARGCWIPGLLSCLVLVGCPAPDPDYQPGTPTPTPNQRPAVLLSSGSGSTGDITMEFSVEDLDNDPIEVSIFYSIDEGASYALCTAASGYGNPVVELSSGASSDFVWDSASDFTGAADVKIRLVPFDGKQMGEAVDSDSFSVTNAVTGGGGEEGSDLNEVGGYEEVTFDTDGLAEIVLNDGTDSTRTNIEEEFMLILVNTGTSAGGYSLNPSSGSTGASAPTGRGVGARAREMAGTSPKVTPTAYRQRVQDYGRSLRGSLPATSLRLERDPGAKNDPQAASASSGEVGQSVREFRVLADMDDSGDFTNAIAILAAVGRYVEIWVDKDVPIEWDYDCSDGLPGDPDLAGRRTYGFDTCDLSQVANIFDQNIILHLNDFFGELSDVDGNNAVTVLITPILNQLTITNSSTEDDDRLVEVYADPQVDLLPYDPSSNPGSNYQEIIFLSAPDPAGFYNPLTGGGGEDAVEAYVTVTMGANIAIATSNLIGFNQHALVSESDPEDDWLADGLGLLAADLTGFGSVVYDDVAYYLDAPSLYSLTSANTLQDVNDRGMQYLLCRYLVDVYGTSILPELVTGQEVGAANITGAIQSVAPEATFPGFLLDFMTAIVLGDTVNSESGSPLTDVTPFAAASTIPLNSTDYYGAGGYQQGINIRGLNYARAATGGGTFSTRIIRLNGADWSNFAPGIDYFGYLNANYGADFTRIGSLLNAETTLKVSGGADLIGRVVRLNDIDPDRPTMVIEQVFGSLATDLIPLEMFEDGLETVGLGEIDDAQKMTMIGGGSRAVADTDLYLIDLTEWSTARADGVFRVNRSMVDSSGTVALTDVLLAVVPFGDLPDPISQSGFYSCKGSQVRVSYPDAYLDYLYYQYVLNPTPGSSSSFNAVGRESDDPTLCNFDLEHEQAVDMPQQNDEEEPAPVTLVDQILTFQVQWLGGRTTVPGFYPYSEDFLDLETVDGNSEPYFDLENGIGGRKTSSGEEALLHVSLPAGAPDNLYVLVVGGVGAVGPYELIARTLPEL